MYHFSSNVTRSLQTHTQPHYNAPQINPCCTEESVSLKSATLPSQGEYYALVLRLSDTVPSAALLPLTGQLIKYALGAT